MKRKTIFCLLVFVMLAAPLTMAGTKEDIMRLQSDVLQLQNQIRDFDKKFDEKTDGLKSLVVQLIDQMARSNKVLDQVSKALESQTSNTQSISQTLLPEIRALSGKIDEMGTRISALAQSVADLKVQSKPLTQGGSSAGNFSQGTAYDQAFNDYMQGSFDLAIQEFTAYLANSPGGEKAAVAQLYLGDAYSAQNKLPEAIASFTRVINDFPSSDKVPSALLKRGDAELAMQETDEAVADFKDIIGRFPASPESEQAKARLQSLAINPAKTAPAKDTRRKSK